MAQPTGETLEAALDRHASRNGEVFPSALKLIAAEEHWTGRLWEVTQSVMADQETMRFVVGGNRPAEVAACAGRWSDSDLSLDEIEAVLASGGYDPDPFVPLAEAGLLSLALRERDGSPRHIHGEKAGTWISDTLALASTAELLDRVKRAIEAPVTAD